MLTPTLRITCVMITDSIAVSPFWSQFGPSTPTTPRSPLTPPLSWSRKPQTRVHATTETTTGEKNRVRKNVAPRKRRFRSTASSSPRLMFRTTTPPQKTAVAPSTEASCGSSARAA